MARHAARFHNAVSLGELDFWSGILQVLVDGFTNANATIAVAAAGRIHCLCWP